MARPHRSAAWSLCLSLAVLPGASTGPTREDVAVARCPALQRDSTPAEETGALRLMGYKLLEAGRVEDAVAFFQLHVVDSRSRPRRTDRAGM